MNEHDFKMPEDFSNPVRLFPLPNIVLFPGVIQALHLFEPRYRQMMDDAMATDQLITMALVKPGPDNVSMPVPDIFPTVCVGKVVTQVKLDDGRYNLLLAGVKRAKVMQEVSSDLPYRQAKVEIVDDFLAAEPEEMDALRNSVVKGFRELSSVQDHIDVETLDHLVDRDVGLSQLVDLICYASGASAIAQQKALGMSDVAKRCRFVISLLEKLKTTTPKQSDSQAQNREFPPDFSLN
jgi:ATP-dependent Lon protease